MNLKGRRTHAVALLVTTSALLSAVLLSPAPSASADTPGNLVVTRATTPYQTDVSPGSPLTGIKDLDVITVNVTADGTGTPPANNVIYAMDARLCRPGLDIELVSQFNASAGNCIADPISVNSSAIVQQTFGPPNTSGSLSFIVGTGTETAHVGPGAPITCDATNPCSLWLRQYVPTGINPDGNSFVHYDLTFAGTPDAPTAVTATGGNTQATVDWTAPANTGNSPLTSSTVTAAPGGQTCTTSGTSCTVTGLDNFTPYTFSVTSTNAASFTSAPSAPSNAVTPGPSAAVITGASGGNGTASIMWSAASPAPTDYTVTSTPGGFSCTTTTLTCDVTGLDNGATYTFVVTANYPTGSTVSDPSAPITPSAQYVTQTFTVTRPAGALVIGENCTTTSALPDTTDYDLGVTASNCNVTFGTAVLDDTATYYEASAPIQAVKVLDTRDSDVGWTVTSSMTQFAGTGVGADTFDACNFGLAPVALGASSTALYTQSTTNGGGDVAPGCAPATGGYGTNRLVMEADAGGGLGYSDLTGTATVQVPVSVNADTYTGVLTFTLITK